MARKTENDDSDTPNVDPAHGAKTRHSDRAEFDDSDEAERLGMSSEGAAADEAETMASTGDSEGSFVDIVAGTATGFGLDRGAAIGTGGLAAGEDLDPVAEGDYWRENFRRSPYSDATKPYEHYEASYQLGWESGSGEGYEGRSFDEVESELEETWDARRNSESPRWDQIREAARDAFGRARRRRGE